VELQSIKGFQLIGLALLFSRKERATFFLIVISDYIHAAAVVAAAVAYIMRFIYEIIRVGHSF